MSGTGGGGRSALGISSSARLTELERVSIENTKYIGVHFFETHARATDLSVRGVAGLRQEFLAGSGIKVEIAQVELRRVFIGDVDGPGLVAYNHDSTLDAEDVTITGARRGAVTIDNVSSAKLQRLNATDNFTRGVDIGRDSFTEMAPVELLDVVLARTSTASECELDCEVRGLSIDGQASAKMERFEVSESAAVGIAIDVGARLDLSDGTVRNNRLGARVSSEKTRPIELLDHVIFIDNVQAIE
jgi:hypothetical protein